MFSSSKTNNGWSGHAFLEKIADLFGLLGEYVGIGQDMVMTATSTYHPPPTKWEKEGI